jgi:phosphatidylserine/phosphatidylglycerophosphate/cardiolipin synthase-like enzyme
MNANMTRSSLCLWILLILGSAAAALSPALISDLGAESTTGKTLEVFYGPEDRPAERIVALYAGARKFIYLASYGLTYPSIIKSLISAKKRGVEVRVITDRERAQDPKQRTALRTLSLAGIPIKINRHDGLMHIKQAIVDDQVNTSGSMNQTASGAFYNDERLDIIHDAASTRQAKQKFLYMWADQSRYEDWR